MVVVESLEIGGHIHVGCLGDQHGHGVERVAAIADQMLEGIVEHRGVTPAGLQDRPEWFPIRLGLGSFPGGHPVGVSLDGVDLAVVGQEAERLGQSPGRLGIGTESLMEERQGCLEVMAPQVRVEVRQVACQTHALVDDRPMGEGDGIDFQTLFGGPLVDTSPGSVEGAFEDCGREISGRCHQGLGHVWPTALSQGSEVFRPNGYGSPVEDRETTRFEFLGGSGAGLGLSFFVPR